MKFDSTKIEFDQDDLNTLHDVIFNALDKEYLTNEQIMKKPKLEDFKREVNDGQDYADWYKDYYQALENYIGELEQELYIHDVEEQVCKHRFANNVCDKRGVRYCIVCGKLEKTN